MTISITNKDQFNSNTNNQPTFVSNSWTPTAGRLAIVTYQTTVSSSGSRTFTLSGNGITWSQVDSFRWIDTGSGTRYWLTVWVGLTGGSPSAGAVTATNSANTNGGLIIIDEVSGADVSGTALDAIIQSVRGSIHTTSGSDTSATISLASLAGVDSASYGAMAHTLSSGTTTQGSGYTLLGSTGVSTPGRIITEYKAAGSTTVDFSWSDAGRGSGLAMEIKPVPTGWEVFGVITREHDTTKFAPTAVNYFEAVIAADSGTCYARLVNDTDNVVISGSEISTTATTPTRVRSAAITPTTGSKEYRAEFGGEEGGGDVHMWAGDLITDVSG